MGKRWREFVEKSDSPKIFWPTLIILWIIFLIWIYYGWTVGGKFLGLIGALIGATIGGLIGRYSRRKQK